jgi:hypothetical protein
VCVPLETTSAAGSLLGSGCNTGRADCIVAIARSGIALSTWADSSVINGVGCVTVTD